MDPKTNQIGPDTTDDGDGFTFADPNLIQFERALARRRDTEDDIWLLRDSVFHFLAGGAGKETRWRFKLGFLSYLPRLFLWCWRAKGVPDSGHPPAAEFLVFIGGAVSKEFDTLQPVVAELARTHSVLVLWVSEEPPAPEAMELLRPAKVWHVRPDEPVAAARFAVLADCALMLKLLLQIALACRRLKGAGPALWRHGAPLFDYLVQFRFWERFLSARLAGRDFRAVAFVSDVNPPGKVLAKMARRRGWRSNHFLHGFPGLTHTWSIATDIHPFSRIERDFFVKHHWPPGRIHALGHPRQCSLMRQIRQHRTLVPTEGGLRLLFAGQHAFKGDYDERQHHQTLQFLLEVASDLQLTPAEFQVRLHPGDDPALYSKLAERYAPQLGKDAISRRSVGEDLAWANVVATVSSTMAVEAAYAECFLIWLAFGEFQFEIREQLIAGGYGEKVTTANELKSVLQRCRDDTARSQLLKVMNNKSQELGILNPRAADASARCMEAVKWHDARTFGYK